MVPALRHLVFHLDQIVALVKAADQGLGVRGFDFGAELYYTRRKCK